MYQLSDRRYLVAYGWRTIYSTSRGVCEQSRGQDWPLVQSCGSTPGRVVLVLTHDWHYSCHV